MRVAIMGQAAFGEAVFKRLREQGIEVAGISAPAPAEGTRPDPLWTAATEASLPAIETARLKSPEGQAQWRGLEADLCLMAFVTEILPDETFSAARLGTVQYHPSLLPLHRGSSAINWAIINRDSETGLSIFWPDQGIDTGPILLQKPCPIGPDDTVGSLYFDRLFPMGVEAMVESVGLVDGGSPPRTEQDHRLSTYEPPCSDRHGEIVWHEPAEVIYARIRGCNPQPGAWTNYQGSRLRIFDCRLATDPEPGLPGRVLRVEDGALHIRLNGAVLKVMRVQAEGQKKVAATEWAESVGLKAGFRFR